MRAKNRQMWLQGSFFLLMAPVFHKRYLYSVQVQEKLPVPQKLPCDQRWKAETTKQVCSLWQGCALPKVVVTPEVLFAFFFFFSPSPFHHCIWQHPTLYCTKSMVQVCRCDAYPLSHIYIFVCRHTRSGRCKVDSLVEKLGELSLSIIKSPRNC